MKAKVTEGTKVIELEGTAQEIAQILNPTPIPSIPYTYSICIHDYNTAGCCTKCGSWSYPVTWPNIIYSTNNTPSSLEALY